MDDRFHCQLLYFGGNVTCSLVMVGNESLLMTFFLFIADQIDMQWHLLCLLPPQYVNTMQMLGMKQKQQQ